MTFFARLFLALAGLLVAAPLLGPRPAAAQDFVASQIENLINSDTLTVDIQGLSGALTGNIRIESVTVSDPEGVFLTASDLAMDWSPLSLVRSNVDIEQLTAGQIVLERLPTGQPASAPSEEGGGFSLPSITANIDTFRIDEFILGEAIAGTRARLSANASLSLADDPVNLAVKADIQRLDQPGQIGLDVAFAPADNRLTLDVQASEPQGGLVATLLDIPDRPAVDLTINGSGPLSNFMANGGLTIGGEQAASLTARVDDVDAGRRIAASLQVAAQRFAPEAYQRYVEGGADLDVQVVIRNDGLYGIEQAQLSSDTLQLNARGTVDPSGSGNDLTVNLAAPGGGALELNLGGANLTIVSLQAELQGAFSNATLDIAGTLPAAGWQAYQASNVQASVESSGFNLTALQGPVQIVATADDVAGPQGIQDRLLTGPVRIEANGALTENGLRFDPSTATTKTVTANVQGTAALNFAIFDLTLDSTFQTSAISAALVPIAGNELSLAGTVARTPDDAISVSDLAVNSSGLTVRGNARLAGETITADIDGTLSEASNVNAALSGAAQFSLQANGPVANPNVDLTLDGNQLSINGQELANLSVQARGNFAGDTPEGTVAITGLLDGSELEGRANLRTMPNGERQVADLLIRQGNNRVTGDLRLTTALAPLGTIDVDIQDIGPLAALGGLQASGDVTGMIALDQSADGTPIARPEITANSLSIAGIALSGAKIDLDVADYLGTPFATGSVSANAIDTGAVAVNDLDVMLSRENDFNALDADARLDGVPVELAALARFAPEETMLSLRKLTMAIDQAPVALQNNATLRIADGVTRLDGFTLSVGDGSLEASGSAGETLDLSLDMNAVPAAVAGPFIEGVEPSGTLNGQARVTGAASDPSASFELTGEALTTADLTATNVPPVDFAVAGSYESSVLTLARANAAIGDGSLSASGTIGETYDLTMRLDALPVGLANGFVEGLNASGTISGNAEVSGPRDDPNARFDLQGSGITTPEIAGAGIEPLRLDAEGSYAGGTATIETAELRTGNASLTAQGTIGETLDVTADLSQFPVGIANGFVNGLSLTGTLSGTASATGPLADPDARFDISGSGITTDEIARSGIASLSLRLAGTFSEGTAAIETAVVNVGDGSLRASGTVGRALDLDVAVNAFPVGLANGFVENLNASGTLSGTARATGSLDNPQAEFDLSGQRLTTTEIAESGIEPLTLDLEGSYANDTLHLATAEIDVGTGSLSASGTVGGTLDLNLSIDELPVGLANGFVPNLNASGTISGTGRATGSVSDPQAELSLTGSGITTEEIARSGIAPLALALSGSYADGTARIGQARVTVGDGSLSATGTVGDNLDLDVALDRLPVGLANGFVEGLGAEGTLSGSARATGSLADPQAEFTLTGTGITTRQLADGDVPPLTLDAAGSYRNATLTLANAELDVGSGSLTATGTVGERLDISADLNALPVALANGFVDGLGARGTISGTAQASGPISDPNVTFDLQGSGITTGQIARSGVAPITFDTSGTYAGGTVQIETARADVGDGSLSVTGSVGQRLDVSATVDRLPVGLANGFVDGLGAQGTLSGTAEASGSISDPNATFDISASNVSVAQSRAAGAPSLDADLAGTYRGNALDLSEGVVRVGGGTITISGTASQTALNIDARIQNLPASIASAAASGLNPQGTINGTVSASGSPASPNVTYDIQASGVSVQQTRDAGVGALAIDTSGRFANNTLTTDTTLSGSGIGLSANGTVEIAGTPTLNLSVDGTAPLSLANRILAEGGRSVQGTVAVNARITGPASQPSVNGTVSTSGASFVDSTANVALNGINASIELNGQSATITSLSANLAGGGQILVGGTVGLQPPFPADLSVRLVDGRYNDGEIITARLSADLSITGPLAATPTISGDVRAQEINILVPENLPSSLARIDVTHVNASPAVYQQARELFPEEAGGAGTGGGVNFDITFSAPGRVFVRGRGLDLELGGEIQITGSAASPSITGGFELRRGRFGILGRRLDFTEGTLTFTGNLIPTLDLLARSDAGDYTVFISVTGPANDPSFTFSANPALPQDEVLARLIFQQGTTDLSPLQIAQLAEAAASLAGVGGSTGLLENLRSQIGVDDIDIKTTADGQTAVGVGKYINDNIYLGVDSTGRVSVDLKLGGGLKARGAVTTEGGGEVGVFYEGEF